MIFQCWSQNLGMRFWISSDSSRMLAEKANQLAVGKSVPKPIVQGRDLIALGYKPSVKFGKWLSACFEAQLDGKFTDHDGGMRFLQGIIDSGDK